MIRAVASVCGILLVLATLAASQQAEDKRARHQQLTRAARLAHTANQPATDEAGSTLTANPPSPAPAPPATGVAAVPAPNRNLNPNPNPNAAAAGQPATAPSNAPEQPLPDQPATPPQVTFRNGLLSVQAVNSTLGSVLTAIRNKAGIQFEGLEGGASERVAVVMGPSPAGEILAAILSGSQFDFVALERPDSPGIVQRVILSRRGGNASVAATAGSSVPARTPSDGDDEGDVPEEQAAGDPDVPQDTPARAPAMQVRQQPQLNPQPNPQPNPQQQQPPTQEQLFQELQRMQQQRLQQQQQQQPPDSSHRTPP